MNRIMIVGQPGSGKSTLAQALGECTGLPVIHIDKMHWQAGWVERSKAEKTRLCQEAEQESQWIFEGGHSATWPSRLGRADMLICLDRPVGLRLWRVVRRAVTGLGRTRPDMADGCLERLSSLPEFIGYIWATRSSARAKIARLATTAPSGCDVVFLCSDQNVSDFLHQCRKSDSVRQRADLLAARGGTGGLADLSKLTDALEASWDERTAYQGVVRPGNPAYGQCYPTSRVVQCLCPEYEIAKGEVWTGTSTEHHFWNVKGTGDATEWIDFTWKQFPPGSTVRQFSLLDRTRLGDSKGTQARCALLLQRVLSHLAQGDRDRSGNDRARERQLNSTLAHPEG